MDELEHLIDGYRTFRAKDFIERRDLFTRLVTEGQKPHVAVVACSDSRIAPGWVLQAEPGEIFMIRNVANLVPPFEETGTYHGTSAALEFAICGLEVEHVVVFGHAHCGGIRTLIEGEHEKSCCHSFVPGWMAQVEAAYRRVVATMPDASPEERQRACEKNAVLVSLENLTTFPWVRERVADGRLRLHGWYFDLETGELSCYDPDTSAFVPVS